MLLLDYDAAAGAIGDPGHDPTSVGALLLRAAGDRYAQLVGGAGMCEFEESGAHFLFDLASPIGLPQEDRTVAAWALTPTVSRRRDAAYQRGYPMPPAPDGQPGVDRGHLIPHLSGGQFGPNIFRQDRALNRGWSVDGKRYRALERRAAEVPGTLFFGHLVYDDETAYPARIEIAVMVGDGMLHVDTFANRPG